LEAIGYLVNKKIVDLQTAKKIDVSAAKKIFPENTKEALEIIRHSAAHLMAQAIKELYKEAMFFVGPVVEEGFYYDFKTNSKISEKDLFVIEEKMREIAKRKLPIERYEITKEEALKKFKDDYLKIEVLKKLPEKKVSIYRQGDFEDLCKGPHVPNTKFLKYFKLTKVAGAHLGGDENKEMLTRIYGIAFADRKALKEYLFMIEEAKKRDHRKLGSELELFIFDEEIGAGLPIWLPKGARLRAKIENMLYEAHRRRGYEPVRGPELLKSLLWKKSGHYDNYRENMYFTKIEEQEYGIKPMNCLGHIAVYKAKRRSYKELPLKFFEYGIVHRHEKSGVLHGLLRVREFTQDDAHIFCSKEQIEEVVTEVLDFVDEIMKKFEFNYQLEISTMPLKHIGTKEIWDIATRSLKNALIKRGEKFDIDEGGGAFYGPKIDIKITDAIGRKWQCGTIQVDFNLPQRFDLKYIGKDNSENQPVMIHRAVLGSFERFIGIMIEHFNGEFPFFLSPIQVIIIPIASSHFSYAVSVRQKLLNIGIDAEINIKEDETLNKKIRMAEKTRVPLILVIGDKEIENNSVAIRDRREKIQYNMSLEKFVEKIKEKIREGRI